VAVTRIAAGIPMGGDLKYVDQVTLKKAMESRRAVNRLETDDLFRCTLCGDCCRGYGGTYVSREDIAAIARFLAIDPSVFIDRFCRMSGGRYLLAQRADGYCIFWTRSDPSPGEAPHVPTVALYRKRGEGCFQLENHGGCLPRHAHRYPARSRARLRHSGPGL